MKVAISSNQIPTLDAIPCASLKGVGPKMAQRLAQYGITSVQDILFHLPLRYQDRTRIVPIGSLRHGDQAVIEGIIEHSEVIRKRRAVLVCRLRDGTGFINLRFFHFNPVQKNTLSRGSRLRCFGEVRGWGSELEIIHPEYRRVNADILVPVEEALTPIYPTTEGLSQTSWRQLTQQALYLLEQGNQVNDYLPAAILKDLNLPSLITALRYIHRPPPEAPINLLEEGKHPAQQRLVFEELLAHQLSLRRLRIMMQRHQAPQMPRQGRLAKLFLEALPFTLTGAQQRVIDEIADDLALLRPMLRLVQGDVGSGKTMVAAISALQAVENDFQAVLMAPTELLAEQHYQNFCRWLAPLGLQVAWLSGKLQGKARQAMQEPIANGRAHVIIGTHALFQKGVAFFRLGLVIVDEQHRFGVHQRLALREKGMQEGMYPHQLIMTATPIPRTLAMTAYADLDQSIIDELPPGRIPITTIAVANERRAEIVERIRHACQEKKQVYWVCTLIEESEILQCQAAENTWVQLKATLPELDIGLVHGRMKPKQKEQVMAEFKAAKIAVLVATTVIEVGVDVPNASLMIIENPERLGLAQLHQLRGRVGRGSTASFCVLLYQSPLSQQAKERIQVMRESDDGFEIAQKDLELRGPGEVLGTRQTGAVSFRIANLIRDQYLIPQLQPVADTILRDYPELIERLVKRWLGEGERYGTV